jgi:CRISPR-associated protein (TIGR02584 family)
LIATLGTEAQVVTASVDLLFQHGERLAGVQILHTSAPGTAIELAVDRLREEFPHAGYPPSLVVEFIPLVDAVNRPLADVATPHDARAAFFVLYNQVRRAKLNSLRVHLSIAGGRKTLAVYGMLAAQLIFDDGDHLWYLASEGDFLQSKRLHPRPDDQVQLLEIPVVQWSNIAPVLLDLAQTADPFEALDRQRELRLRERVEAARAFIRGALTPAEERVVARLVIHGQSDHELAASLNLSPRTVEAHLRSTYQKAANHWELESVDRERLITLLNFYYLLNQNTGNPA